MSFIIRKLKSIALVCFSLSVVMVKAQMPSALTIEKIMQDPLKSVGWLPENIYWGENSQTIFFNWNPEQEPESSLYKYTLADQTIGPVSVEQQKTLPAATGIYSRDKSQKIYIKQGDLFLLDRNTDDVQQITSTLDSEQDPFFSFDENQIFFTSGSNLFSWDRNSGRIKQWTDFRAGAAPKEKTDSIQAWLENQQLDLFEVLKKEKAENEFKEQKQELLAPEQPKTIYVGETSVRQLRLSPDQKYITYNLVENQNLQSTEVPKFVTQSGHTATEKARAKVGLPQLKAKYYIYDLVRDTVYQLQTDLLPGISKHPEFYHEYSKLKQKEPEPKSVYVTNYKWSGDGKHLLLNIKSVENKDRWLVLLDPNTGKPETLHHHRDEAWIAGPGIGWVYYAPSLIGWLPDHQHIWFQSESDGFAHLYLLHIKTGKKKQLTQGHFEVYDPILSRDGNTWYFTANRQDPGIRQVYRMPSMGGKMEQLTDGEGGRTFALSPDEKWLALRYSETNQPWELYLMKNEPGATPKRITHSYSQQFMSYEWRKPAFITFEARDGAQVNARLYRPRPANSNQAAVIFVHGAGYLQNAHRWWSSYFREYMFHNFLVDQGYTVLDIDYRGSAGYGREWRTGIYRHMGGKDLDDQVDGAKMLVKAYGIDPGRIGIYGGSYGGFITLMGLFTQPEIFAAGAALRSVTDWAHYNHVYTSNILNTPVEDSLAYHRSSPINFVQGLQDPLLICHGMIDDNVQFQDVVRLSQRLIELKKEEWEMAVYPVERHSFEQPESWMDEYKRIYRLFEQHLKNTETTN
ncbi:MAG: prolyl oligopeptidase family serine peptidase [Candidatus Cyclobacteriaceae bacterium M3_2C_046]